MMSFIDGNSETVMMSGAHNEEHCWVQKSRGLL